MHLAFHSIHKKHPGAPPNRVKGPGRYFTSILSFLFALMAMGGLAQPTLEFVPANQTIDLNVTSDLTATIRVNGSGLVDAAEIHLNFDPTILQVKTGGLTAGSTLPIPVQAPIFDNTLGTIDYAAVIFNTDVAAGFDLLTIEFEVIGTTSPSTVDYDGTRPSKVTLDGSDILSGTTPLTVTIEAANTAPVVNITAPTDGADITRGQSFALTATVVDTEEPGLGSGLNWSSSDVAFSGSQSGLSITDQLLEPGPQTITASITDAGGLTGEDQITVNVSCPQVSFLSPLEAGNVVGTSVDVELDVTDLLFGTVQSPNEHLHFFINPPDVDNLDQSKRISTANDGPQTTFTFDENSGALAFDGNGNGIQLGVNTIVVVAAQANHTEFTCEGAKAIVNFTVSQANTAPVITIDPTASVDEGGNVSVPLNITDADGDNLTVTITSVSNEPQDLQSANSGKQVDPFPTTAAGFLTESSISAAAGSYSSSLDFTPTFGDGGSNGDGSAVYTITVEVLDEDNNTISQTLDLTVNDVDQVVAENSTTRIEAESFDEQGPDNTSPGNTSDNNGIGVEVDNGFTNIGFTNAGDFAEYEIDVETAGVYRLDLFVGVPAGANKGMEISSNGNLLATFNPTSTGGFTSYQIQTIAIALPAGQQTLRFDWVGATSFQFNIDYFELSPSTAPTIVAVDDQEIDEGSALNVPVTVTGGDENTVVDIIIYDKSVPGGTNSPFTPAAVVPNTAYSFTETPSGSGVYELNWPTGPTDGRSYEARVTADDGVNPVVQEVFQINVAQDIPDIILAMTFGNPITPWYGGSPPGGFVSIENNTPPNIGWIDAGEFVEYLIDVPAPGLYDLRINASKGNNSSGLLTISEETGGGFSSIGAVTVINQGWTTYTDYNLTVTFAQGGLQTLRFDFAGGMNIREFEFTEVSSTLPPVFSSNIPDQFNLEGDSPAGLVAQASDPDGGTVTYSDNGTLPPGLSIDANTGVISGTISAGAANGSPYAVVITATDDEPETATLEFQWTVTVPVSLPVCVNCGNQPGVTAFGRSFTAEQFLASAPANIFNKLSAPISGTAGGSGEEDLFQSETYDDPLVYAIPTGNGDFTVELYLVELYIGSAGGGSGLGAGDRVFNIDVEGQTENGIDLFSDYGPLVAATKTFAVTVADGILNINLDATTDNAKLAGFCITPTADFVANAAPTVTIDTQDDIVDCESDGEDVTLTASASDAEQGDLTATIIWKDENGAQVGTGPSLALLGLTATATYTAEVTDATPSTTTESITVNIIGNTPPSLTSIQANPSAITVGGGVSLSVVASDNEDDNNTLIVTWSSDLETANNGVLGTGLTLNPILTVEGTHTITASVTDACGIETTETVQVVVEPPVPCDITAIVVDNISSCNDNGTDTNLGDDTFTADITVTFNESAPITGSLVLGEEATGSIAVDDIVGNSYTFTGVTMPADGTTIIVSAAFSDEPTCELTNINAGTAPEACSVVPCQLTDIVVLATGPCNDKGTPEDPSDDTFFQFLNVTLNNAPAFGTLEVTGSASYTLDLNSLTGSLTSIQFNVEVPADGAPISYTASIIGIPGCSVTNDNLGNAPEPCSVPPCTISAIDVTNISACNNQTTADGGDDTFTADITVTFNDSAPTTGSLVLGEEASGSVPVADITGNSYTFVGVSLPADGTAIIVSASFSDDPTCAFTNSNAGTAPEACPCTDLYYADTDEDGYGDPNVFIAACSPPEGYVANDTDCDDDNGDVNPAAQEICNGIDDDCDGLVDDEDDSVIGQSTWYADTDEDGYGDPNSSILSCEQPEGYVADDTDCDDGNGDVNPAAQEICNGIDDDCDGLVDDEDDSVIGQSTWYADTDEDGYGDPNTTIESCNQPEGYVANDGDCDDGNGDVNPDAQEVCDGIDNDCDGLVDDEDDSVIGQTTWYADTDEDGYGDPNVTIISCEQPDGYVADDSDCDDGNGDVNPAAQEICNGIDDDCDGLVDDEDDSVIGQSTWYADTDEDGYGDPNSSILSCEQPEGYVADDSDCDDSNGDVNPDAQEVCDGIDNDCDGLVDGDDPSVIGTATWYADTDEDGYGDPASSIQSCNQPDGYVANDGDCDDGNGDVNPDAQEVCNGIDDDCDGLVDDEDDSVIGQTTWYADTDEDGYGDPNTSVESCNQPDGYVANDGDCDDGNGDVNPAAQEICNGIDDDCDGLVDDEDDSVIGQSVWYADTDEDGYGDPNNSTLSCTQPEGYVADDTDCDDSNGDVNPVAQEICNGIDDDCDGLVDGDDPSVIGTATWYADTDEDGYGDPASSIQSCNQPDGYVANDGDCDDTNGDVNPDAQEVCNGIDDDCDGLVDDEDDSVIGQTTWYADTDEDGYGDPNTSVESCNQPDGYVANDGDCDDGNGDVNPAAQEICNGIDDDCDGLVDDEDDSVIGGATWYADTDGDGYGDPANSIEACEQPTDYVANDSDCDDTNGDVNPDAQEVCDGIDNDCDGLVDGDDPSVTGTATWYADTDEDGYGDPASSIQACNQPDGYVANDGDCDDGNGDVNPAAQEVCNGIDDDCDGLVDDEDDSVIGQTTWYADTDEDGYGDPNTSVESCNQPDGYVANDGDCDDGNGDVNPAAQEICNGIDDDCDGLVDDEDDSVIGGATWYADTDGDGYGDPANSIEACEQPTDYVANDGDCDDTNGDVNPDAQEVCDGIDNDCDGLVDGDDPSVIGGATWYADTDGDGYGDPNNSTEACDQPSGFVANDGDCDDTNGDVNPDAQEVCDGIDNDCDGLVDDEDDSVVGQTIWYADTDGDGYGDPANSIESCEQPTDYVANDGDCDDTNGDVNPDAVEVCNGIDDNCDGNTDEGVGTTWYADTDGDGYGDPNNSIEACDQPGGYVANDGDCDDGNGDVNPDAQEVCNGIDDDCDGLVDGDDPSVIGGATWYADTDGDGYGDPANSIEACNQPTGYVANADDCDDTNGDVNPDAQEVCNGIDDNCDGLLDEDDPSLADASTWYADTDGDGFGDPASSISACDPPAGYVANDGDCDDTNGDVNPNAEEICDGIDNNCDGETDEDDVCVTCIDQVIDYNDFDDAWGIWNDGGTDCRLNDSDAPFAVGGTGRAVRLRDNTFSSVMTTDALDLSAYEDLKITFSFLTIGFDNILEDFWLQVSTDGSPNFTTIAEWDKGDEFENGIRYFEEVTLTGPFTSNMKFRFRCDASSDTDWLFIDNVEISGCFNPSALVANPDLENKTAKEGAIPFVSTDLESELETAPTNLQLFPNPVADELLVRFTMQEMTDVTVMVTDLQGRRIGREQLLNAQGTIEQRIAVEQYPAGIYLLHLITPEGKQIQKFVVARN